MEKIDDIIEQKIEEKIEEKVEKKIMTEADYVDLLEDTQSFPTYHKNELEYEGQKTEFGEAFLVEEIKRNDLILLFNEAHIVTEALQSKNNKNSIWLVAINIFNGKENDIVVPNHELIEKVNFEIKKYELVGIEDCYAELLLDDKMEKLEMPSTNKETKLFDKIVNTFNSNKDNKIILEVMHIMGKKKIVNIL